MNPRSLLQYGIPIGIFLFGVAISMWYGGQGLHPLDSSIVFDGGWRVLQGQRFFVDFSAPNGFVPAFLQMCFFRVLGVNWFAYCLHAAVFNGIFAILAYGILRTASGPRWLAAGYALLSAVVFYPLMGVPYMEQHAFFFILLAIFVGLRAAKANGKWRIVLLGSLPCIVLLAVLSKQSPGMFALPLLGIVLLGWFPLREWKQLILLLLGGLIPAVLVFIVMVGLPWQISGEFWESFWNLPQALANERFEVWSYGPFKTIRTMAWFPFQVLGGFHFIHRYVLYAPFLLVPAEWLFRKLKNKPRADWPPFRILFLAIGLTGTCSFFMNFTLNQPENGLPYVFVALGLGHIFWRESWKGFEANLQFRPKWLAPSMLILSLLFLANGAISAFHFHGKANSTRIALDFSSEKPFDRTFPSNRQWGYLNYQAPDFWNDLKPWEFVDWMNARQGNFLLFGDLSIVYGLTGRPSVSPALWFHEGLTIPKRGTDGFAAFDLKLRASCQAYSIRYLVFEQATHETWMHSTFESFPETSKFLSERQFGGLTVGGFLVVKLDP